MFTGIFKNIDLFKILIQTFNSQVDNLNLHCNEEGIRINAMDHAKIALMELFIPQKMFHVYHCPENHALGIKVAALTKILKLAKGNNYMILNHAHNSETLDIKFADSGMITLYITFIFPISFYMINCIIISNRE